MANFATVDRTELVWVAQTLIASMRLDHRHISYERVEDGPPDQSDSLVFEGQAFFGHEWRNGRSGEIEREVAPIGFAGAVCALGEAPCQIRFNTRGFSSAPAADYLLSREFPNRAGKTWDGLLSVAHIDSAAPRIIIELDVSEALFRRLATCTADSDAAIELDVAALEHDALAGARAPAFAGHAVQLPAPHGEAGNMCSKTFARIARLDIISAPAG